VTSLRCSTSYLLIIEWPVVLGRSFVKRFALCYRTVVLSVCPVCNVGALQPNDCTDQDEPWHTGRTLRWPQCVRWGPNSPPPKEAQNTIFRPYMFRPNGCMDQDATWYGGMPHLPPNKNSAHVCCGQTAGWIKMVHLERRLASAQSTLC